MKDWPADQVKRRPLTELTPYARNSRTHSDAQVRQIAASMQEFGWTVPILVDEEGGVIAGHGRILAAEMLEYTDAPCMTAVGWTDAQKRAYVIADNKLAENAGWDDEILKAELQDLTDLGFEMDLIGFDPDDLIGILSAGAGGGNDPDELPTVPIIPKSKPGDVWIMGRHRIICGSSTDEETVSALLGDVKPHLMVTDPPYGVEYDATWRKAVIPEKNTGATGGMHGKVANDNRADWSEAWALFPGEVAYVWHAGNMAHIVAESLIRQGFEPRAQIIWRKHQFVIGRGHYHPQHEPLWYMVRKNGKGHWTGSRKESTIWDIDKPLNNETGHSTQKPVECMRRPIELNSSPGQAVYDPFCGSGTTIIAAEETGRACYAIELNPIYVDVAVTRWQNFTGEQAILERTGEPFPVVKAVAKQA